MRQFFTTPMGSVLLAGALLSIVLPATTWAQSVEPAAAPGDGSMEPVTTPGQTLISLGEVGEWSIPVGFEVSRRVTNGPDGEVKIDTVQVLNASGEVVAGPFAAVSVYPNGITMEDVRLDVSAALRLTVDSIAASTRSTGVASAISACQVGGLEGSCTEFTVPSANGALRIDARAVVVGDSLVTTVLVLSSDGAMELASLLDNSLRLHLP